MFEPQNFIGDFTINDKFICIKYPSGEKLFLNQNRIEIYQEGNKSINLTFSSEENARIAFGLLTSLFDSLKQEQHSLDDAKNIYSADEQLIGSFFDVPLYRKCFFINTEDLGNGVYDTVNHNGSVIQHGLDIRYYIRTDIIKTNLNSDLPTCFPLSSFSIVADTGIVYNGLNYNNDYIVIENSISQHLYPEFYLILEYTKN